MTNLWAGAFTPEERLLAEQAVPQYRARREACVAAPHGKVLAIPKRPAVDQGREAKRRQWETARQQEAAEAENRGAGRNCEGCAASSSRTAPCGSCLRRKGC